MASVRDHKRSKQEKTSNVAEMTKLNGVRGKDESVLGPSSCKGTLHVFQTSHENAKHLIGYHGNSPAHKNCNTIHPKSYLANSPPDMKTQRQPKNCWEESAGFANIKDLGLKLTLGLVLVLSLTALVLVVLDVMGVIGPTCVCDDKLVNTKQQLTRFYHAHVSTTSLVEKINKLERNITSQTERNVIMSSLLVKHQREILELKSKLAGFLRNQEEGPSTNKFKQNITTEMRKLREKQVQLDSSLTNLKENDETHTTDIQEMQAKVIGLAVAVKFLSTNDSLIKSKVRNLSLAEVKIMSSLESLKQKDAELDKSLQRAKSVEAFLNSSMSQLKSVNGQLKTKMDQLKSTFMTKINKTTGSGQGKQVIGPLGAPGAGNVSQCYHEQKKFEGTAGPAADYYVNFVVPRDKIVVGATCSTIRGDETNLSSATDQRGEKIYMCTCKGESNVLGNLGKLKCFIDVWVCPKIS